MRLKVVLILILLLRLGSATAAEQEPQFGLRLIVVETEVEAADLRARLETGSSFEDLAMEHSVDPSSVAGGYLGTVVVANLRQEFKDGLAALSPGEVSPIVRIGDEFALLQLLTEQESRWIAQISAGIEANQQGRYADAGLLIVSAVEEAEGFGPEDPRLAMSLNRLAELYRRMCANLSWKLKRLQTPWFDGIGRNNIKPVRERSRDEESVTFGKETQEVACAG